MKTITGATKLTICYSVLSPYIKIPSGQLISLSTHDHSAHVNWNDFRKCIFMIRHYYFLKGIFTFTPRHIFQVSVHIHTKAFLVKWIFMRGIFGCNFMYVGLHGLTE